MSEDRMREAFNQVDADGNGTLDQEEVTEAMKAMGKSDDEIAELLKSVPRDGLDFAGFKQQMRSTSSTWRLLEFKELWSNVFKAGMSEKQMREVFDQVDTDGSDTLDKEEITIAMRDMGKSEKAIRQLLDSMPQDELDFEGFKQLLRPDTSRLGRLFVVARGVPAEPSEDLIKAMFAEFDLDGDGLLDREEVRNTLRSHNVPMTDIEIAAKSVQKPGINVEQFKRIISAAAADEAYPRARVADAFKKREDWHKSGQVIVFPKGGPPKPFEIYLYELERDVGVEGLVKYAVHQEAPGAPWRAVAVIVEGTILRPRLTFPKSWRGLKGSSLTKRAGIAGCISVSVNGTMAMNETCEGAVAMSAAAPAAREAEGQRAPSK